MSTALHSNRPLANVTRLLRDLSVTRQRKRSYGTAVAEPPTTGGRYPLPSPGFRTSQAIQQNRYNDSLRKIRVYPPPRSTAKACPDPIKIVTNDQIAVLDPKGARARLFHPDNPDRVNVGDILMVRQKNGDPFSGVCLAIRQRHQPIDTAILLRNQLTRVGVEMWYKIYSPNVEGIEVVQRKQGRRARRAKLYFMRQPRHDFGSVENVVRAYLRRRAGGPLGGTSENKLNANKGKGKRK